eukprot:CAMPEP_0180825168 /NCGR_PEP_ID=MMETSP1038_2-20121128/72822_1 /TAXON_ID=632150 /ORGANISM="Azadinium spinosum, Strain 3D9" /LENGTH=108 /DNA_ID=CAMNT_0022867603 /DNA_START=620 /DNA_END=943 /DNA_ORIENTATION=+
MRKSNGPVERESISVCGEGQCVLAGALNVREENREAMRGIELHQSLVIRERHGETMKENQNRPRPYAMRQYCDVRMVPIFELRDDVQGPNGPSFVSASPAQSGHEAAS